MRFSLDLEKETFSVESDSESLETHSLYSLEAFSFLSTLWLKMGWNAHYHYTFTWAGRPILQLPEDIMRLQEVVFTLQPDLIIETGIALGGSLLFYASLCKILNKGHVLGIDCALKPHTKEFLQKHSLSSYMSFIEADSLAPSTLEQVQSYVKEKATVLVILDSNHSKEHVRKELEAYCPFVTSGSYLVVCDGFKQKLHDVPRGNATWKWDHPAAAAEEFLLGHSDFFLQPPERIYNKSPFRESVTHFDSGWLRRR